MQIVYYFNQKSQISPVKEFLLKYDLKESDSKKQEERKIKILAYIDQTIQFITEHKGRPIPPVAKPLKGYKFHEMRIKDRINLVRILYFCYTQEKLVLLNAFEKPDLYEKGLKKKVDREINKMLKQTQQYYQDFLSNQIYEEYK
ncbi:MAG: type II toxin-antitoxin system RelE/ParE family toxin [Candidatus Kuenenbacteria bacterium]